MAEYMSNANTYLGLFLGCVADGLGPHVRSH
jgi:hypothetical protein